MPPALLVRPFARRHLPAWMLVLSTLFWGMGFSWSKNLGEAIDRAAGVADTAALGPVLGLAVRFSGAAAVWGVCLPSAWRGWSWRSVRRGLILGASLWLGLVLQHVGLGLSDESVIAFLTALTVVFVPVCQGMIRRTWPGRRVMTAVGVAVVGMALLCGVRGVGPVGMNAGAGWGVACAAAFAAEILLLDRFGRDESPARLTLLMFAAVAGLSWLVAAALPGMADVRWRSLATAGFLSDMGPAVWFSTLVGFGLMNRFQPQVDPTKAALLYLFEPLFAAAFAWWLNGRAMSADALAGAALILSANVVAEWRGRRL